VPRVQHFGDTFSLFEDAQRIIERLVLTCGEFDHLQQARIPALLSQRALVERGRSVPVAVLHGACYEGANSATRNLNAWLRARFMVPVCEGHDPDFIVVIDVALWPKAEVEREHLLYHALCHIEQRADQYGAPKFGEDGRPMLRMRPHDIERFATELGRYGSVIAGFEDEAGAYDAARAEQRRNRLKSA
jgi:hypothetical protein